MLQLANDKKILSISCMGNLFAHTGKILLLTKAVGHEWKTSDEKLCAFIPQVFQLISRAFYRNHDTQKYLITIFKEQIIK